MRSDTSFEEALAFGEEGERLVAAYLMSRGAWVMPVYQFRKHDQAPLIFAAGCHLIAPDLYVWRLGRDYHAECKRKTRWVKWDGKRETGFNLRHYDEYRRVSDKTQREVVLFFLHEKCGPTGLYCGRLSELSRQARIWDGKAERTGRRIGPPEALFPLSSLTFVCGLKELAIVEKEQMTLFEMNAAGSRRTA